MEKDAGDPKIGADTGNGKGSKLEKSGGANPAGSPGGGGNTGGGNTGGEKKNVPRLAFLDQAEPKLKEVDVPAIEDVKKKSKKATKKTTKKEESQDLKVMTTALLGGLFAVLADKNSDWQTSESEIELIADPASRILSRMESLKGGGEKLDYLMLAFGVIAVAAPRVVKSVNKKREGGGDYANTKRQGESSVGADTSKHELAGFSQASAKSVLPGIQP